MTSAPARFILFTTLAASVALLTGCLAAVPAPSLTPEASESSTSAEPTACADLTVDYAATDNSAGHAHGILTFTNDADAACTIEGYPAVHIENAINGDPMGAASSDDPVISPSLILLGPGDHATAAVTITRADIVEGCDLQTSVALLVAAAAADVKRVDVPEFSGCKNDSIGLLSVGAFAAG
jgi:hypothetical protein